MPSPKIIEIKQNSIPQVSISQGELVAWKNSDTVAHQINSNLERKDFKFDVGIIFPGDTSSPVIFDVKSGSNGFDYGCGLVPNVISKIFVDSPIASQPAGHEHEHDHGHDHLKHFHGFVTGGHTGDKIYMTHTPIFLDERHHFQIILQASFAEPKHLGEYNKLRASDYGNGKVQLFFDHLALIDIESGVLKELDLDSLRYYPDVPTIREGLFMKSVATVLTQFAGAKIKIDQVLCFRKFTPDMSYPETLTYLMYGNEHDVFIDHFISRAPNFHSVARLKTIPAFWNEGYYQTTLKVTVPSRRLFDVSPKMIKRVAFLDNQFHLTWGVPSGTLGPQDPLLGLKNPIEVLSEKGDKGIMEISHYSHFDATRLLNDGLGF